MATDTPADGHQTLVAALRRRDANAAEKAMREHVRYGANSLRLALGRLQAAGGCPSVAAAAWNGSCRAVGVRNMSK